MGYHYAEEEKALARPERRTNEVELSATDYWLDDTLQVGFKLILKNINLFK